MHELAITQEIVSIVLNACKQNEYSLVKQVVVELGDQTTYKAEPLLYYFDILKQETDELKSAQMIVHEVIGLDCVVKELVVD